LILSKVIVEHGERREPDSRMVSIFSIIVELTGNLSLQGGII
jgi:hypothetical protein